MATETGPQLRLSDLASRKPTRFRLEPNDADCAALAEELGILGLRKLRMTGELTPKGKRDWELKAELGATVVQPCVVTLAPVTTRIDTRIERLYTADYHEPDQEEAEIPDDDRLEPVPETLDLSGLMAEELALALPLYPRADGAELGQAVYTQPGAQPLTDEAARPFSGLESLRDALARKGDEEK